VYWEQIMRPQRKKVLFRSARTFYLKKLQRNFWTVLGRREEAFFLQNQSSLFHIIKGLTEVHIFSAYVPKVGLCNLPPVYLSPLLTFECLNESLWNVVLYHGTEHIWRAYYINASHQSVCLHVYGLT
jgi:hypothetical protein